MHGMLDFDDGGVVDPSDPAPIEQTTGGAIFVPNSEALPRVEIRRTTRNGIPLLPVNPVSSRVTPELVYELGEDVSESSVD